MDEITRLLRKEGLVPCAACMSGSGLQIGLQVKRYPYCLVYRIDEDNLILCSFHRVPGSLPQPSVLVSLWRSLLRLFQQVSWLRAVRMLVITDVWDRLLAMKRHQLVRLLYKLGAVMVFYNGESWLEISSNTLRNHRKRRLSHY